MQQIECNKMIVDDPINIFLSFLDVNESPPSKIRHDSLFCSIPEYIYFQYVDNNTKSRFSNINEKCSIRLWQARIINYLTSIFPCNSIHIQNENSQRYVHTLVN